MVTLDDHLSLAALVAVVRRREQVKVAEAARQRLAASRAFVDGLLDKGEPVYGVNTGFGKLQNVQIAADKVRQLQRNLIRSHSVAVGERLSSEVVRAMLLLRAQSLALGFSGVRPELIDLIVACLNEGVHPEVPSQGSVGASGDLAPLAHVALTLLGEGHAEYRGERLPSSLALSRAGLAPIELEAKEGLALVNGTQAMTALGALTLHDALELCTAADIAGAMSIEALKGTLKSFDPLVIKVRPHHGAGESAENLRRVGADSPIHKSHEDCEKIQDAYSLRCMPQVHGASRGALWHALDIVLREINSVTDNPLIFAEEAAVISAGNFHGQPLALAMDYAKIAIAELADISERRTAHLHDPSMSGLPAFLTGEAGLHSGLMISQYTAASLVSENKTLAHPASVDSIPTSANQEDHVSMGLTAARQAAQLLENARQVIAIELLNAAQALEFHRPLEPGPGVKAALEAIRRVSPAVVEDRPLSRDVQAVYELMSSARLRRAVEDVVGELR